ncbi:MAG: dockerin type I domain-containing protein [Candidatus Yanofskybacteria bacterium]|nr:dockerin type I domain-containing protein [Candidatus Yanofskybacteria bacterium]
MTLYPRKIISLMLAGALFFSLAPSAWAEVSLGSSLSSDNFKVLDSQHTTFGGTASASSSSFLLQAVIGGLGIGSSSFSSFSLHSGFLYFPKVIAPVLDTATAGNAQVSLAWTAAQAFQGWNIGSYNVCTKPSSGSYTCEDVGSVVTYVKTGLSNGTAYDFKIEAEDGIGNVIAVSNEKSATPVGGTPTPTPSGGGGGGGGGYVPPPSGTGTIIIKGTAYPTATVNIYIDLVLVSSIRAGGTAKFEVTLNDIAAGIRVVGVNSEDLNGRKSIITTYDVTLPVNGTVTLGDILVAPTIDISSYQVQKGEVVRIFGQSAPSSDVTVHVFSEEIITNAIVDSAGAYSVRFNTDPLVEEEHTTKSRSLFNAITSPFSQVIKFLVGGEVQFKTADLNKDGRVNIVDFSILLFWWNTNQQRGFDIADINGDRKVNVVDFSIMLFQWTG